MLKISSISILECTGAYYGYMQMICKKEKFGQFCLLSCLGVTVIWCDPNCGHTSLSHYQTPGCLHHDVITGINGHTGIAPVPHLNLKLDSRHLWYLKIFYDLLLPTHPCSLIFSVWLHHNTTGNTRRGFVSAPLWVGTLLARDC